MKIHIILLTNIIIYTLIFNIIASNESIAVDQCVAEMHTLYTEQSTYWGRCKSFLGTIASDIIDLNLNLISKETFMIAGVTIPAYFAVRQQDRVVHNYFYDSKNHKNRHELPFCCKVAAEKGLAIPLLTAAGLALFSRNEELRLTSYAFWIGMPCSWGYKKALKATRGKHCLRPANEHFDKNRKSYGGFPSGHIMEMVYVTTLFGIRYGPKVWVPLTAASAYMFAELAICNRHYVSQLVVGAGIGAAFGFATNKLVAKKLAERYVIDFDLDAQLRPSLKCCYRF